MRSPIKLKFSEKYDEQHAQQYLHKHQDGIARRLSHQRDEQLARRAWRWPGAWPGAGPAQRCRPFLAAAGRKANRVIIGADNSAAMLQIACGSQPAEVVKRVRPLQTSAFAIDLPDNAVDSIFCMRLFHHIGEAAHRKAILSEFQRVSRDSVIISLWVDGNIKAWRRKRLEARRNNGQADGSYQNRFVLPAATVEQEFEAAGFRIQERMDFLPFYAMWRVYVLRKG